MSGGRAGQERLRWGALRFAVRAQRFFVGIVLLYSAPFAAAELPPVYLYSAPAETVSIDFSPAGSSVAILSSFRPDGKDRFQLDVFNLATRENVTPLLRSANISEIVDVIWLNESRILVEIANLSSVLVDLDTGEAEDIAMRMGYSIPWKLVGAIGGATPFLLGEFGTQDEDWLWRIDGLTGERIVVDRGVRSALGTDWFADQQGNFRLKRQAYEDRVEYELAAPGSTGFETRWRLKPLDSRTFEPIAFEPGGRYFYAAQDIGGTIGLVKVDTGDTAADPEVVLHYANFSVRGSPVFDMPGERGNIVGFNVDWLHQSVIWAEPYAALRSQLEQLLPGANIQFEDIHAQSGNYVVLVSRNGTPGVYYLGNIQQGTLQPLRPRRSQLTSVPGRVVPAQVVQLGSVDGAAVTGEYLAVSDTGQRRGAMIFAHSNYWTEDRDGFDTLAQFLVSRGYDVIRIREQFPGYQINSAAPMVAGFSMGIEEWARQVQERFAVARDWLVHRGEAPARVCILGDWFAGSVALTSLADRPGTFACAVTLDAPEDFGNWISSVRTWGAELYETTYSQVFGSSSRDARQISPVAVVDRIREPVLMLQTWDLYADDGRYALARQLQSAGVDAEFIEFENEYYNPPSPEAREAIFTAIETFLDRHLPAAQP